jgi:anti-sigma factor (TIGR02949 family)
MNCAWARDRLLLYLAGELEPREAEVLREHLESCARCAAEAEALAETEARVTRVLRSAVKAPTTLDARVMEVVRHLPPPRRSWLGLWVPWRVRRRVVALSAALSLVVAGYFVGHWQGDRGQMHLSGATQTDRPTLVLALLGDDHLKYLANPQPAEIPGPDPRQVALGLMPLLKFPVAAVDLQPEGARLLGGRKCEVHGVPIAFLLYDWKGERVSLYQIDGRKIALPPLREVVFRGRRFLVGDGGGLSYIAWRSGVMNFVMVSGAKPERLLHLACTASGMSDRT